MKKKVIVLAAALMLLMAGVVSAAAKWGTFEGYNIVRLVIDGKTVAVEDTPPVILKGRTMVPISLLEEAGLSVTWDKDTYTVNVKTNRNTTPPSNPTSEVIELAPLYLYSYDGETYLGKLTTNIYDSESIFNQYGDYGSKYSQTSIWNEYGNYGSPYQTTSAFNKYTTEPPIIVENNEVVGYVSANTTLDYSIHPNDLYDFLAENGY